MKNIAFIWLLVLLIFSSCKEEQETELHIAVAANMQFAMKELTTAFTDKTGIPCALIISSSGKLTAQIKENAPYDVFIAANMKYPNVLFKQGYTIQKPKVYAYGQLVMWSNIDGLRPSFKALNSNEINHIALANPKMAPYGEATIEVLKHHKLYLDVKEKLVYGESIAQTNQFIISKAAQIGFTAKSIVLSPKMKGKGNWLEIDDANYSPIEQGIVIMKKSKVKKKAKQFYTFLFSKDAQNILTNYGYKVDKS